jgi:hypothetical protein
MVLRLVRLGKEIHSDSAGAESSKSGESTTGVADDLGVGEAPGMSSVLRDDNDVSHDRVSNDDENGRAE